MIDKKMTGRKTTYKASNDVVIDLMNGMCFFCHDKGFCPHSDRPEGKAVHEYLEKGHRCFTLNKLRHYDKKE